MSDPQWDDSLAEYDHLNHPEPSITEIRVTSSNEHDNVRLRDSCVKKQPAIQSINKLQHVITQGFPDHRNQLPDRCRHYWNVREHLTVDDGLIVYGCCLLIPSSMRQQMLASFHELHQGSVRTKERARLLIYWPGIDNDIDNIVLSCKQGAHHIKS